MVYAHTRIRLESETYKPLWDFEIKTDNLIPTKKPDRLIVSQSENKRKRKEEQVLGIYQWTKKKAMAHEGYDKTNCNWCDHNDLQRLRKGLKELEIRRQEETVQTIALLTSAKILRRVLETWRDLLPVRFQWKTTC